MKFKSGTNIFRYYNQEENRFTNGLISILELAKFENNTFIREFFKDTLSIEVPDNELNFKVLREFEGGGSADAEISNDKLYFLIETKIKSGTLVENEEQIKSHLKTIKKEKQKIKNLILLTPDNSYSGYVKRFIKLAPNIICHLNWKMVYDYLNEYIKKHKKSSFTEIISQYLSMIRDTIFDQDIVAVIVKIAFGDKSGVYRDKYLDEIRRGEWLGWGTPGLYKNLDGKGRKLILYDPNLKALTVEVEIKRVVKEKNGDYPWRNIFVSNSLTMYELPIPVAQLEKIEKFKNFRKCSTGHWNLTHEQYEKLKE